MQVISTNNDFASGGKRLAAYLVDWFLLHALFSILFFRWWGSPFDWDMDTWNFGPLHLGLRYFGYNILEAAITVLYYSYMESSKYQATVGKMALGIKVVDVHGAAIAFPKAVLRNLSKYLSAIILYIGYLMIIFDDRKQGLHDKIADTLVVNQ
jgi:uncharacterized RDD family membrane protein YckC